MYRIILVDDEAEVRESIRKRMNWESLGFQCAGDFENGIEALEAVDKIQPEVVLTDINMPFMDGLELTKQIHEKYPHVKVLILTGYDDFDYAQKAIKLKVQDFILKPITALELKKVLLNVKQQLDDEKHKYEDLQRLKMILNQSMPIMRERFLEQLVTTSLSENEIARKMDFYQISLKGKYMIVLTSDIDELGNKYRVEDTELISFACFNIISEMIASHPSAVIFRNHEDKVVVILSGNQMIEVDDAAQSLAKEIMHTIDYYLGLSVSLGIGRIVEHTHKLSVSYKSSLSALEYRLLLGRNKVLHIEDLEGKSVSTSMFTAEKDQSFVRILKTGTKQEVEKEISKLIQDLRESNLSIQLSYLRIQTLLISILNVLEELGCKISEYYGENKNPLLEIYLFKTLDEMEQWLKHICTHAISQIVDSRSCYRQQQVRLAEQYLWSNYGDEKLSIKEVCRHVHMSTSYFSAVFKQYTGKTFVEYLTMARMDKAKELLKFHEYRTFEIAAQVGYADPHYFSILFKKYTGETPTEFRQKTN